MRVLKEVNLDEVAVVIAGFPIIGGYGTGGSLKITKNAENFSNIVGRSGEVTRSKNLDQSAVIELTLAQTSPDNSILRSLYDSHLSFPVQIQDRRNGHKYTSSTAYVQKDPEIEFSSEATDRVWQIFCAKLDASEQYIP